MRFQILQLKEGFLGALAALEQLLRDSGGSGSMYIESARRSVIAFGRAAALLGPGGDPVRVRRRNQAARDALRVLSMDLDVLLALGLIDNTRLAPTKRSVAELDRIDWLGRGAGGPSATDETKPETIGDSEGGASED